MPILPVLVMNIVIGLFALVTLFVFIKTPHRIFNRNLFFLTAGLYFCYLLSLTYTKHLNYGLLKLSTSASLFIFPLLFSFLQPVFVQFLKVNLKELFKIYIAAVVLLTTFSILNYMTILDSVSLTASLKEVKINGALFKTDALYMSMHLAIASVLSAYLFYISRKVWKAVLAVSLLVILFIILVLLSFKATVIAFLISLGTLALFINKRKLWALFITGFVSVMLLVSFSASLNHKFTDLLIVKSDQSNDLTSFKIRASIDSCTRILLPEAGILGYGIGDGKIAFLNCLEEKEPVLYTMSYNTHNQYTSIVLYAGFLALAIFLVSLIINVVLSVNAGNAIAIALTVFFVIIMFSENILERQQGVMPYAIFISLLYMLNFSKSKKEPLVLSHEKVIKEIR